MKSSSELLIEDEYKDCRTWIEKARKNKKTWDEILYAGRNDDIGLSNFLDDKKDNDFWSIEADEWKLLVEKLQNVEDNSRPGFIGEPKKTWISVPEQDGSCWQNYKKLLIKQDFTYLSISNIEKSSQKIVTYLRDITEQNNPVRGMVVGNVQSGKTANMAGVISMAADYGYNFFIVLTGTIDNLRIQTRNRLMSDLNYKTSNVVFQNLDNLSSNTQNPNRLQDLHLNSNKRYINVCLKNSTRLKNLLSWINRDQKAKENLKVLVIDDEADQAGVNTKNIDKEEQTTISRLIKNIVFGRDANNIKKNNYKCMNYIGYTATPYANLLNESGEDTLYPKDFISMLSPSSEYFGPQQIFGVQAINDPLNIVNTISKEEVEEINNGEISSSNLPCSLKESLLWFNITVACFRFWNLGKCISMLIHTSQKIEKHDELAKIVENYFKHNDFNSLKNDLIDVYNRQCSMLTLNYFKEQMKDYNDIDSIKSYPAFVDLIPYLEELLDGNVNHIQLEDDKTLSYTNGLHLCVDNCSKKSIDDNSIEMRIIYPDEKDPIIKNSPAFIVIGGSTLSRGLTLQGLTTTYFLRNTSQADTLMQMARWFGFRKKYELLPRIWLSSDTINKFNLLTKLDYDLRQELYSMEIKGLSPKQYGPKLDSFPDYKKLVITAKKKRQSIIECETTFYNKTAQSTWFFRDDQILQENYKKTLSFLNSLGDIDRNRMNSLKNPYINDDSIMWFDVDFNRVIEYLRNLKIPHQAVSFDDYNVLKEWYTNEYEKGTMNDWTIVAGTLKEKINNEVVLDCGISIKLENRTRYEWANKDKEYYDTYIDLNTIHQPNDRLMDIDCSSLSDFDISMLKSNNEKFLDKRIKYASKTSPLLVIYIVDKDSEVKQQQSDTSQYVRYSLKSLNLTTHIVGYYLYIPYGVADNEGYVTIKLKYDEEMDGEINEDENM